MKTFYVYLWLRSDGMPYYVGKGSNQRGFRHHRKQSIYRPKDTAQIIIENYTSESEAFVAEKFFIDFFGRADLCKGCLLNLTDGGDGTSGVVRSKSFREKIQTALTGRKRSTRECRAISKGQKNSPSLRRRVENMAAHRRGVAPWNKGKVGAQKAWNVCTEKEMVGRVFGRWTVLKFAKTKKVTWWLCRCSCGTIREVASNNLRHSQSTSCGCTRRRLRP
jgi:hypothetical protein